MVGRRQRTEEVQGALSGLLQSRLAPMPTLVRSHAYRLPTRGSVQAREPQLGSGCWPQWCWEAALVGIQPACSCPSASPRGQQARVLTAQSPGCRETAVALRA